MRSRIVFAVLFLAAAPAQEQLTRHINLGKAFYENPTTQKEAAAEFKKALALNPNSAREQLNYGLALLRAGDVKQAVVYLEKSRKTNPALPHTYFNLGVVYKKEGDFDRAMAEFTEMAKRVPDEPVTRFNLGMLHKLQGAPEKALAEFELAAKLDSTLAAPHFQLYNSYRAAGRTADAQRELQTFNDIKKRMSQLGLSEDMDWCYYAELLEEIPAVASPGPAPVEVSFAPVGAGSLGGPAVGLAAMDANGDGKPDILAWGAVSSAVFVNGVKTALPPAVHAAVGDFNNDTFADVALVTSSGVVLAVNNKGVITAQGAPAVTGVFRAAVWVDFDHDYDLDLMLLGEPSKLMRNNGDGSWTGQEFPFAAGNPIDGAVLEVGENNGFDVVVAYEGKPGVLYRDLKMGKYEAVALPSELPGRLVIEDFNHDSFLDVASVGPRGTVFLENKRGRLEPGPALAQRASVFADFQNRGRNDLLAGGAMFVHKGGLAWDAGKAKNAVDGVAAAADFSGDGLADVAVAGAGGEIQILRNTTPVKTPVMRVGITGVKNIKLAPDARVEVKAGNLYQKKIYRGMPLVFAMPGAPVAEAVRITWPNGLIQNELRQKAGGAYTFKEAQRLSGSCPMIFTWNGNKFEFISDVLGVAPLGAGAGDGQFFPVDHDEYVQIRGDQLVARDGKFEIRVTEELREVSYLDQIKLIAMDHPAEVSLFTNDKFKAPPFPEFKLFGVRERIYPKSAVDHLGRDVLALVTRQDARYPASFVRDMQGRAEPHSLTLDFAGAPDDPVMFLHGWVDWADGSTFVASSQAGRGGLAAPSLQVKDSAGNWVTVIQDMGMPAGKPKAIAVDLRGKFLSASREVRIVTSMAVYWDEIFVAGADVRDPQVRLTGMGPATADLRFRGFSAVRVHPERRQPEHFDYHALRPLAMWNPTPGMYTRYGDVKRLIERVDDWFVVMGSGDEVRLEFDATALAPPPKGWTRDFLIFFDGYAKDADANTAHSSRVDPLPFHAMPGYPYPAAMEHPDPGYQEKYNTRPALRLIRPLVEGRAK